MAFYMLADRLHKSVAEIEEMSIAEIRGWFAYLRLVRRDK